MMDYDQKKYARRLATAYIGVVGPDIEYGHCRDSIANLRLRAGDGNPRYSRATKGYEARQKHLKTFLEETKHGCCLLLDSDMVFPADTLERLRAHGLPFITGYYMRRQYNPVAPVWYEAPESDDILWPMMPYLQDPECGKLHELGASGWGCMLVHREVLEATAPLLKGEDFVIEDDMDVWPYDLEGILAALHMLQQAGDNQQIRSYRKVIDYLAQEFRPLRGTNDPVGSDLRFPFYARQAGYKLYGDPDVRPGHNTNYPLSPDDYTGLKDLQEKLYENMVQHVGEARMKYLEHMKYLNGLILAEETADEKSS